MNGGLDPYQPYQFLKECNENFQTQYVNCFRFLTEVSTKLQKMHFFRQFKDHNLRRKHGN